MAQVEARRINKKFGEVTALHSVDLSVNEGEFLVFLGPSGCGKSTLLRLLAGVLRPSPGTIRAAGRAPARRRWRASRWAS